VTMSVTYKSIVIYQLVRQDSAGHQRIHKGEP
jgi:hypothetical protein